MTYIPFFLISKNLDFIKVFPKILFFGNFGGQKPNILKFQDFSRHFVERVILHLYWPFCVVSFKSTFGKFFNIEPILVNIGVK